MLGGPSQDGEGRGQALRQCLPWNLQGCPRGSQNLPPNTPASLLTLGNCAFCTGLCNKPLGWSAWRASTPSRSSHLHRVLACGPPFKVPSSPPPLGLTAPLTKESSGATWFDMYCVRVCASQPDGQALGPWLEGQEDTLLPTSYTFSLETRHKPGKEDK